MNNRLIASRSLLLPRQRRKRWFGVFIIGWMLVASVKVSEGQDFRIDNQLRIAANDCYTRIAIGSRLPDRDVTSTLPAGSLSNCERACSGNRTTCNAFSFGIDAKGNGTCALGRRDFNMRGRDLVVDPDYDVYERRAKMPRGCQHDRLLTIAYGANLTNANGQMNLNPNMNPNLNPNLNANMNQNLNPNLNANMNQNLNPNMNPNMDPNMNPSMNPNMNPNLNPNMNPNLNPNMNLNMNSNMNPTINMNPNTNPNISPNMNTTTATGRRLQSPFGSRFLTGSSFDNFNPRRKPSFIRGGWYSPLADDTDTRLYDILTNKNLKPNYWKQSLPDPLHVEFSQDHVFQPVDESILGLTEPFGHRSTPMRSKWNGASATFDSKWNFPFSATDPFLREDSYTTPKDSPEHETRGLFEHGIEFEFPGVVEIDPILEKTKTCYRKLLVGKRLSDSHVMRSVRCERIEDCHRVCEYESAFVCEGFNYGRMQNVGRAEREGYTCQLTSTSAGRMDLRRDFVADPRWDYYERDWRCPAEKPAGVVGGWPRERPPWPPRSSLPPINRPANEIAGPPRRPVDRYPDAVGDTRYYSPEKARPIDRPVSYDYHSRPTGYLPERPAINVHYHRQPQLPQYIPEDRYRPIIARPYGGYPKYPDRRVDQNGWISEARPNEIPRPDRDWQKPGSYGPATPLHAPVYGPSYSYETNPYPGNFEPPRRIGDSYPRDEIIGPSKPARRPANQENHYGYNYGPAYGYGGHSGQRPLDSYVPSWKPQQPQRPGWMSPGNWGGSRDCSVRSATGFKLARKCVEASYATANLEECEMLCASRKGCLSFAYRYSLAATAPTDNCLLSNAKFEKLDFYTDLEPDRDYDIYAMMSNSWNCQGSRKPTTEMRPHDRPPEECFWRVRSGFGMPRSLTREEFRAENGLGECQIACVSARHFTCRSFVFRYDSERDRGSNCFLSDCPTREIIPAADGGLPYIDEAELYERGSYGRGCEPYPFATIYGPADVGKQPQWTGSGTRIVNRGDEGSCYSGYPDRCKLSPYAVSSVTRTDSETECRRKCSKMRNSQHTPCMAFSYKVGDEKRGDNCYLSDVPRRDLRPGLDYTYDDDYVTYAWKELEPQCSAIGPAGYPNHGFHGLYQDSGNNGERPPLSRPPPPLGQGTGILTFNHLLLGVRPLETSEPDPLGPAADYPSIPSQSHQNDDGYTYGLEPSYQNGFASFNRYYTVNGYPCKRGTKCERNRVVGFWSCEPEDAEIGSWDYCCEPNHHCGFSQGHRYPWCYVGPSEDQWRPCSDKYYPYLPSPRPAVVPPPQRPNGHGPLNHDHFQPPNDQDSSTYHSRHWPIAFLHPIPPPNTTNTVAPSNDRRDDQHATSNVSSTSKSPLRSAETVNSSITRVQLHKSHLKRRGLITNRTRAHRPKSSEQRIHRIYIIPTKFDNDSTTASETFDYSATADDHVTKSDANYYNSTDSGAKTIERKNEFFDSANVATATTEGGVGEGKKAGRGLGRIERVTRPAIGARNTEASRRDKIIAG